MEDNVLLDKVALITGSSRGIGRAIAQKLARAGADVVINHRKSGGTSESQGRELCTEIQAMGRRAVLVQSDISIKESVQNLIGVARERFGRLDILILNAASAPLKPIEKLLERDLRQLVATNYLGNIFCIQEALPLLEKTEGRIVFISSLGSRFYNPSYPLGSMKAAMEAVVRDCSEGLRDRNISVNAVCGGIVRTKALKALRLFMPGIDRVPDALIVEPEEIADVVLFLCSPASIAVRGQTIVVDKGISNSLYRPINIE